jgi:hypothetical protein
MSCLTDAQIAALALEAPFATGRDHLAGCAACAARLAALRTAFDRLEGAVLREGPGHGAGRDRLLAALATEPVPVRPLFWRIVMNRRNWAVTAAVVMIAVAVFLGWGRTTPVSLADTLKPFKEAKSFACDMVTLKGGKPDPKADKLKVRLTWAAPGSIRTEILADGQPQTAFVLPHGKPGVSIDHREKKYTPLEGKMGMQEMAVHRLINKLAAYTPGEQKPAGTDEIDGLKAPRFDLTLPDIDKREWHFRVWAHPVTKRPLQVEFPLQPGGWPEGRNAVTVRLEHFEWDAKVDGLFDTTPPAGYRLVVMKPADVVEMMTKRIVASLEAYGKLAGRYPEMEPFDGPKAALEMEKLAKKKLDVELVQGFVLIGVLQSLGKDAVYHGKTVGPGDKEKVLFRWKLDDGQYRVIFGDLKTETVSAERLKTLEGK